MFFKKFRVPLVDHVVVVAAAALPDGTRFAPLGKKLALRHTAMGRLEDQLFERPKSGFVLPIERWMREGLLGALWRDVSAERPAVYFTRVRAPFVLLEWARQHDVRL
ncbi:MAG TPA: asparagine synthase-related protein [Burkholderiales bacterium]|nr:asparagine synthase-related protein [Burkholderiales bacterium]